MSTTMIDYKKMGFKTKEEYDKFMQDKMKELFDMIKNDPELLNVFKRLKYR
jgi:hypothetical protein